jgi:hypothetical protein
MRIKPLKLISHITIVLMALSLIPSFAFASGINTPNHMRFGPEGNITEENFTAVQTSILDSISKQITELQSFYTNVSEASNATDLQEVLFNHRQANERMGPGEMNRGHGLMNRGHCGIEGFNFDQVENVTDDNFTGVQTEIVDSLGNMTDTLNDHLNNKYVNQDSNRTEEINERITELKSLSTEVSEASSAAELKEVVFAYMQNQAIKSIEQKIEHLQTRVSESENNSGNTTGLSSRITELTTLKEKINAAESLDDLKKIMSSYHVIPGMRDHPMRHAGHAGHCH